MLPSIFPSRRFQKTLPSRDVTNTVGLHTGCSFTLAFLLFIVYRIFLYSGLPSLYCIRMFLYSGLPSLYCIQDVPLLWPSFSLLYTECSITLAFLLFIVYRIFLYSLALCNTTSFFTLSVQLTFSILIQHPISKLPCSTLHSMILSLLTPTGIHASFGLYLVM